jgi:hypothetical protein
MWGFSKNMPFYTPKRISDRTSGVSSKSPGLASILVAVRRERSRTNGERVSDVTFGVVNISLFNCRIDYCFNQKLLEFRGQSDSLLTARFWGNIIVIGCWSIWWFCWPKSRDPVTFHSVHLWWRSHIGLATFATNSQNCGQVQVIKKVHKL